MTELWEIGSPMKDLRGYLSKDEINKIINKAGAWKEKLLMEVLWQTGARVSEIVGLRARDNPKEGYISRLDIAMKKSDIVEPGVLIIRRLKKGSKHRYPESRIIVTKRLTDELMEFAKNMRDDQRIFPVSRQWVFEIVRRAASRAGIKKVGNKKVHPHHFRHSHAIAYIKANNDMEGLRKLQLRLGHATIGMTAHYLQYGIEGQRKQMEEIFG